MHGGELVNQTESKNPFDRLSKKSALVALLCGISIFVIFAYLGDPAKGRPAAICVAMTVLVVWMRWDLRKRVWFWITITILVLLHVPLVLLIPWSNRNYPGVVLLPQALLDFSVVYGCIKLVEKAMRAGSIKGDVK